MKVKREFVWTCLNLHKRVPSGIFAPPAIIILTVLHSAQAPLTSLLFTVWTPRGSFCLVLHFFYRKQNNKTRLWEMFLRTERTSISQDVHWQSEHNLNLPQKTWKTTQKKRNIFAGGLELPRQCSYCDLILKSQQVRWRHSASGYRSKYKQQL